MKGAAREQRITLEFGIADSFPTLHATPVEATIQAAESLLDTVEVTRRRLEQACFVLNAHTVSGGLAGLEHFELAPRIFDWSPRIRSATIVCPASVVWHHLKDRAR